MPPQPPRAAPAETSAAAASGAATAKATTNPLLAIAAYTPPARRPSLPSSVQDAVPDVRGVRRSRGAHRLEPEPARVDRVEEPDAVAEQHGRDVELHLVDQPGVQKLLPGVRAARDQDVP